MPEPICVNVCKRPDGGYLKAVPMSTNQKMEIIISVIFEECELQMVNSLPTPEKIETALWEFLSTLFGMPESVALPKEL